MVRTIEAGLVGALAAAPLLHGPDRRDNLTNLLGDTLTLSGAIAAVVAISIAYVLSAEDRLHGVRKRITSGIAAHAFRHVALAGGLALVERQALTLPYNFPSVLRGPAAMTLGALPVACLTSATLLALSLMRHFLNGDSNRVDSP